MDLSTAFGIVCYIEPESGISEYSRTTWTIAVSAATLMKKGL